MLEVSHLGSAAEFSGADLPSATQLAAASMARLGALAAQSVLLPEPEVLRELTCYLSVVATFNRHHTRVAAAAGWLPMRAVHAHAGVLVQHTGGLNIDLW